jgi:carboxylesterase type B
LTSNHSGDKDRMILWGQSAGANAVVTYSYANPTDPIVRGLVAASGAAPAGVSVNTTSFTTMATSFGCGNLTAVAELACMQKVDARAIQKYARNNTGNLMSGERLGGYVADNVTVFANNTEQLLKGHVAKVVS